MFSVIRSPTSGFKHIPWSQFGILTICFPTRTANPVVSSQGKGLIIAVSEHHAEKGEAGSTSAFKLWTWNTRTTSFCHLAGYRSIWEDMKGQETAVFYIQRSAYPPAWDNTIPSLSSAHSAAIIMYVWDCGQGRGKGSQCTWSQMSIMTLFQAVKVNMKSLWN